MSEVSLRLMLSESALLAENAKEVGHIKQAARETALAVALLMDAMGVEDVTVEQRGQMSYVVMKLASGEISERVIGAGQGLHIVPPGPGDPT